MDMSKAVARISVTGILLAACPVHAQAPDDAAAWWRHYHDGARLVTLADGKKVSLYCEGKGAPLAMMVSGAGSGAWTWHKVQSAIARTTRTCTYDRPGYWNSPPAAGPHDAGTEADDLAALLKAANLPAPYVIVAHSYGGYIARLYAGRHTADLAGLVLVDPSSAHQDDRFAKIAPPPPEADPAKPKHCAIEPRPADMAKTCILRQPPPDLPPELVDWFTQGQTPGYAAALGDELEAMPGVSSTLLDAEKKGLGAVPFLLLNRGKPTAVSASLNAAAAARLDEIWLQMHQEIMDISSDAELRIIYGASHRIQDDKPDAVITAVTDVVTKARKTR